MINRGEIYIMSIENALTILQQIVTVVLVPIVIALVPTIKKLIETHTTAKQRGIAEAVAKVVIHSVEQQYPELTGDKKYVIAVNKINKALGDKFDYKELDDLIESTVNQMNIALGKLPAKTVTTQAEEVKTELPTA